MTKGFRFGTLSLGLIVGLFSTAPGLAKSESDDLRTQIERAPLSGYSETSRDLTHGLQWHPEWLDEPAMRAAYDSWTHRQALWSVVADPVTAAVQAQVKAFWERSQSALSDGKSPAGVNTRKAAFADHVKSPEFRAAILSALPTEWRQDALVDQVIAGAVASTQKEWGIEVSTSTVVPNYSYGDDKWDRSRKRANAGRSPHNMDKWQRRSYNADTRREYQSQYLPKTDVEIAEMVVSESLRTLAATPSLKSSIAERAAKAAQNQGPVLRAGATSDEKYAYHRSLLNRLDEPGVQDYFTKLPRDDFYGMTARHGIDRRVYDLVNSGKMQSFRNIDELAAVAFRTREELFLSIVALSDDKKRLVQRAIPSGTIYHHRQKLLFDAVYADPMPQAEFLDFAEKFFTDKQVDRYEIVPFASVFQRNFQNLDEAGWERLAKLTHAHPEHVRGTLMWNAMNSFKTAGEMLDFIEKSPAWNSLFDDRASYLHNRDYVDLFAQRNPSPAERARFRAAVLNNPKTQASLWRRLGSSRRLEAAAAPERSGICMILFWSLFKQ